MPVLLGSNAAALASYSSPKGADYAQWERGGLTATAGDLTDAYIELGAAASATGVKLCIWNDAGSLVASTAEITTAVDAVVTGTITGTLTAVLYYPGWIANGYITYKEVEAHIFDLYSELDSYATPGNIVIPGLGEEGSKPRLWFEGTLAGGVADAVIHQAIYRGREMR